MANWIYGLLREKKKDAGRLDEDDVDLSIEKKIKLDNPILKCFDAQKVIDFDEIAW